MQVPLKRPKEAESSTSELLNLVVQANVWPVEFPDNINAPGNIFARPYQIHYPACGSNYPSRPEFRGWNCKTLADNKADLFTVVNNLSTSSSSLLYAVSAAGPITAWEQQLLFAVAMQVSLSFMPKHHPFGVGRCVRVHDRCRKHALLLSNCRCKCLLSQTHSACLQMKKPARRLSWTALHAYANSRAYNIAYGPGGGSKYMKLSKA